MKSIVKVVAVALLFSFLLASCKSSQVCPAYSKNAKVEQKVRS